MTFETFDQSNEETWPDWFAKFFRFSEISDFQKFQIFRNFSDFRKFFRFAESFWKIFRFSENFQIFFGNFSDFGKIFRFWEIFSDFGKFVRFSENIQIFRKCSEHKYKHTKTQIHKKHKHVTQKNTNTICELKFNIFRLLSQDFSWSQFHSWKSLCSVVLITCLKGSQHKRKRVQQLRDACFPKMDEFSKNFQRGGGRALKTGV